MEGSAKGKRRWSPGTSQQPSEAEAEITKRARLSTEEPIARQIIIHRVSCSGEREYHETHPTTSHYLDIPAIEVSDHQNTALHGQNHVEDVEDYLEDCFGFSIVVFIDYDCEAYHERIKDDFTRLPMPSMPHEVRSDMKPYFRVLQRNGPLAEANGERLQPSETLQQALHALQGQNPDMPGEWDFDDDLVYPYPKLYHYRHVFAGTLIQTLEPQQQMDLEILFQYVNKRLALDYEKLEELSNAGIVSQEHWLMIFRPDDTVITTQDGQHRALTVKSCRARGQSILEMNCSSWEYDGNFFQKYITIPVQWPSKSRTVAITDLSVYPIRHATEGLEIALRKRGETFWSCRRRKYVSYDVPLLGLGSQLVRP